MKKQDQKVHLRMRRLQYKRERKRINRKLIKEGREKRKSNRQRIRAPIQPTNIIAPAIFTIQSEWHRTQLLDFLEILRESVMKTDRNVIINFYETRQMVADGTLLFYAELDRLNRLKPSRKKIKAIYPKNSKVSEVLEQIGIYDIVGPPQKPIIPSSEDVVHWKKATGKEVVGEKYNDILESYDGVIPEALTKKLYIGITEAMANCVHHAYIDKREDGIEIEKSDRRWWMFSQSKDGRLSVVFCDLGVGIPKTLPVTKPDLWKKILSSLSGKPEDGNIIKEAVEESRSRTGESHRGKGLSQLVDFIHNQGKMDASRVTIFSNYGAVKKSAGEEDYTIKNYRESILGTLIQWDVPIREENE